MVARTVAVLCCAPNSIYKSMSDGDDMSKDKVLLYAWHPDGHGDYSFFVAARSQKEAIEAVEEWIANNPDQPLIGYHTKEWGTDYYNLTVLDIGQVITNAND